MKQGFVAAVQFLSLAIEIAGRIVDMVNVGKYPPPSAQALFSSSIDPERALTLKLFR